MDLRVNTILTKEMTAQTNLLLSVVIPVYKSEAYLSRCVQSVLNQAYTNIEVIIVDDGSGPECQRISAQFMASDDRVRYYRQETNKGLLLARIKGIELSHGAYITHLDSDDWISDDVYSSAMAVHTEYESKLVVFNVELVNDQGKLPVSELNKVDSVINRNGESLLGKILQAGGENWVWHLSHNKSWDAAFLKNHVAGIPNSHLVMCEDLLLTVYFVSHLEAMPVCSSINATKGLYYYKHAASSTVSKSDIKHIIKNIQDLLKVKQFILSLSCSPYLRENRRYVESTFRRIGKLNYPSLNLFFGNPWLFTYAYYLQVRYIDRMGPIEKIFKKLSAVINR